MMTGLGVRRTFRFGSAVIMLAGLMGLAGCGDDSEHDNPAGVGNACDEDADCATDDCYLGSGGGYCTSECMNEGSLDECPLDTICKPIQGGPRRCLLICGSESACDGAEDCGEEFCPDGSGCVDISDSDGLKGCEPDPG